MKKTHRLHRYARWLQGNRKALVPILAVVIVGAGSLSFALVASSNGSASPEVRFTDASRSGLAIVPASGASTPSCPTGYSGTYPDCVAPVITPPVICQYGVDPSGACMSEARADCTGTWTDGACVPDCYYGVNPNGTCESEARADCTGTWTDGACVQPSCPTGTTGTYPVCSTSATATSCPAGFTGTPPDDCVATTDSGTTGTETVTPPPPPPPPPVVVEWKVLATLVQSGETVSVAWNVENVEGCTVTGTNGDNWTDKMGHNSSSAQLSGQSHQQGPGNNGAPNPLGGNTPPQAPGQNGGMTCTPAASGDGCESSPITGQTIYTLYCKAIPASGGNDVNESTTVNIVPVFNEL